MYNNKEPFKGDRYEGDWRNGNMEGKGIYYYNNEPWKGERYEGDWINNKKEGKGIYYYNNGDREIGDWKNDKEIGLHVTVTKKDPFYLFHPFFLF